MRAGFQRVLWAFAALLVISTACSKEPDLPTTPVSLSQVHRPRVDPRTNPLQTYIRDTWVNGSTTATGGSHYSHVKIYGHSYANLNDSQTDATFIANHFDCYMWGGSIVGSTSASVNPDMLWLHEAGNIPNVRTGYDSTRVAGWIANPTTNPNGFGWKDLLLYYKYNTTNWVSTKLGLPYIPGWNPADDTDGDGCIEAGEGNGGAPSDPNRSAMCQWDARVRIRIGQGKYWMLADVTSPAYIDFTADEAKYEFDTSNVEGFHFDVAAYQPASLGLNNTFKYEGLSETDLGFPYQEDKLAFVPSVMADAENHIGEPTVAFANMVSAHYSCNIPMQHDGAREYLENLFLENWIGVDASSYGVSPANTSKRESLLDCTFLDYLVSNKGVALGCFDPGNSERGRMFTLGMFYLINHQLAFYYYRTIDHDGHDAEHTQWNPWVAYDIGQPVTNNLALTDFEGNSGTDRFFVFATGTDYEILGRQYLRSDNKRVMVLVKLMGPGRTEGQDSASHALGGNYRKVLSDFSLGSVITQVTLANNEAVILVKSAPPGCHDCNPDG